jgi:hypothetical protein
VSQVIHRPGAYDSAPTVRGDLVRLIIDYRASYEKLCGVPPLFVHVSEPLSAALTARGFKPGAQVAGMTIIARTGACADEVICSRDENLFAPPPEAAPPGSSKAKRVAAMAAK